MLTRFYLSCFLDYLTRCNLPAFSPSYLFLFTHVYYIKLPSISKYNDFCPYIVVEHHIHQCLWLFPRHASFGEEIKQQKRIFWRSLLKCEIFYFICKCSLLNFCLGFSEVKCAHRLSTMAQYVFKWIFKYSFFLQRSDMIILRSFAWSDLLKSMNCVCLWKRTLIQILCRQHE